MGAAKRQGLCKHIGLGSYPPEYVYETDSYRTEPIAAHHAEINPFSSTARALIAHAKQNGVKLTAMCMPYLHNHKTVVEIAERTGMERRMVMYAWQKHYGASPYIPNDYDDIKEAMDAWQNLTLSQADIQ